MKKISKPLSKEYRLVHLYLDDLRKIEDVIHEAKPKSYKITADYYEYNTVSEISNNGPIYELKIQSYDPYINIEFRKYGASVYISNDDLKLSGVFSKINQILTKSERKVMGFPTSNTFVSIVFGAIEGQLISYALPIKFDGMGISLLLVSIVFGLYLILAFSFVFRNACVIETISRRDKQSFLKKNQDQLILIILGAFLGAIATVLLERFFLK